MAEVDVRAQLIAPTGHASAGGTAVRFEDYVSNPPPGQEDAASGLIGKVKSPFMNLIQPSEKLSAQPSLPPAVGLVLESEDSNIAFYDITGTAACSDVKVFGPLTLRFVDPGDPGRAAGVSEVGLVLVGEAVQAGEARVTVFDVEGRQLATQRIEQGDHQKFRADVMFSAEQNGQPTAAIHRVMIERLGNEGLVLGAGRDVDDVDLRFNGLTVLGSAVATAKPKPAKLENDQAQWSLRDDFVRITDLATAEPAEALSDRRRNQKWKVFEYETAEFSGKGLAATPQGNAPQVSIPLNQSGWHAVYIGLSTIHNFGKPQENKIKARLSGERAAAFYRNSLNFSNDGTKKRDRFEEVYIGAADLTGRHLDVESIHDMPAFIGYVKLIPLTDAEAEHAQSEQRRLDTRTAIATFDGHGMVWRWDPRSAEDIASTFANYVDSDFGTWWLQTTGADMVNYESAYGTIMGEDLESFPHEAQEAFTKSVQRLIKNDVNVAKVAIEEAHRQNAEVLMFSRVGAWASSSPWEEHFISHFYLDNPQWRTVDRDGTEAMYMSYAYPEVQEHVIDVLRETVEWGADGVGLLFHRGMPMMLWEQGFLDRFDEAYGIDAREVPEDDPRLYDLRAQIVTEYLQRIRKMLDEVEAERNDGKRLKIGVSTFATEADNRKYGLDVEGWAEAGLVDQVASSWFAYHTSGLKARKSDVAYYVDAVEGTSAKYYPFILGRKQLGAAELVDKVAEMYRGGADGIAVWDTAPDIRWAASEGTNWNTMKNIGHREQILDGTASAPPPVTVPLTRMGENRYNRWQPNTGY